MLCYLELSLSLSLSVSVQSMRTVQAIADGAIPAANQQALLVANYFLRIHKCEKL